MCKYVLRFRDITCLFCSRYELPVFQKLRILKITREVISQIIVNKNTNYKHYKLFVKQQ